jgi:hypothetical protein
MAAHRACNQQQAGDEQQVIDADPDMFDAEQGVLARDRELVFRVRHGPAAFFGFENLDVLLPVQKAHLEQRR